MSSEGDLDQSRLSSAPLLGDDSSGAGMATYSADISPVPKQLEIQNNPGEVGTTMPAPQQSMSLSATESIASATGGAKVNREYFS